MNKIKFIIFFTILLTTIGMGIVVPILPHYVSRFGASPFIITLLFSIYALCAFLSAPLLGSLSDKFGRRPLLLVSILTTFIGWVIFAAAQNLWMLFFSRIIDGLAAGNISIAQGALVDISTGEKERTSNLGIVGAAFGIGYIIGPLAGGILSNRSLALPFWLVVLLSLINLVVAFFLLPETHRHKDSSLPTEINPFRPLSRAVKNKLLRPRYSAWFFYVLGIFGIYSTFALYLEAAFGFDATIAGYIFTIMGIIIALNQTVLLKKIWLRFFKEPNLEIWMLFLSAASFFVISFKSLTVFIIGTLLITSIGQPILRVVMASQVAGGANKNAKGEALGIMSSVQSVSMAISPVLAGLLYEKQIYYPYLLSGLFMLIAFFIIFHEYRRLAKINVSKDTTLVGT